MYKPTVEFEDLKKLRVINNLVGALSNLGVSYLSLVKEETRKTSRERFYSQRLLYSPAFDFCDRVTALVPEYKKFRKIHCKKKDFVVENAFGFYDIFVPVILDGDCEDWFWLGQVIHEKQKIDNIKSKLPERLLEDKQFLKELSGKTKFTDEKIEIIHSLVNRMADELVLYYSDKKKVKEREEVVRQNTYQGIIFSNPAIKKIITGIEKAAASDSPIMIYGESGVGKEVYTKLIHSLSARKDKQLLILNCAALTESLLEAELFGYEKGSFTGAERQKLGLFEIANGGTVFLDEIGDMSPSLQVKILRLLQEGTFIRVGGVETIHVDVRVIGATNKNIQHLIKNGKFREDLYFRLAVFELSIPPLRERKDEVELLANFFVDKYEKKMGKNGITLDSSALEKLLDHDWPGNVRELENEIERAVALTEDYGKIGAQQLSQRVQGTGAKKVLKGSLKRVLNMYEGEIILETLNKNAWKKPKTAKILGITQQWLNKRIHALGIDRRTKRERKSRKAKAA